MVMGRKVEFRLAP